MSFDPGTLQAISMGGSAVSGITGAFGALTSGNAKSGAAMYQAAVARNNQTVAEQNAEYALQAGRIAEANQRQKTAQLIGSQRVAMAGNGVDLGSGTPQLLQQSTGQLGELDALTIRNNAARQAYNYRVQAGDFGANAELATMTAKNAKTAGNISAFSSIVGGAGNVAEKWNKWRTPETTTSGWTSGYDLPMGAQ